ncbi:MAG: cupin domain-containing protein [Lautropia sp.]
MIDTEHGIPDASQDVSPDTLVATRVSRFAELEPDWNAFADSQEEGRRRAQFRLIGAGGSGKYDGKAIPAGGFTMSIMRVPPGQGGSAHCHEVEEAFFVLDGILTVFFQDAHGHRAATRLQRWEVVSCPAGVMHGFVNEGDQDVYMQTIIGTGKPGPVRFADDDIYQRELGLLAERASNPTKPEKPAP